MHTAGNRTVIRKIKGACRAGLTAWWVLLIIVGYAVFAWRFLGTSCILASTTGLPCPGCGATRAFAALLKGDITGSLRFFPLLIPSVAVIIVYAALWLMNEHVPKYAETMLLVLVCALLVQFVVRLVLYFPRTPPLVFNYSGVLPRIIRLFVKQ